MPASLQLHRKLAVRDKEAALCSNSAVTFIRFLNLKFRARFSESLARIMFEEPFRLRKGSARRQLEAVPITPSILLQNTVDSHAPKLGTIKGMKTLPLVTESWSDCERVGMVDHPKQESIKKLTK